MIRNLSRFQFSALKDTNSVSLKGISLKGNYNDLPNLIFFTEVFDSP